MKKFLLSLLVSFCLVPTWLTGEGFDIGARAGYFLPMSDNVRKIYSDGWAEYELDASYQIYCPWSIWANVGYMHVNGHSIVLHNHTDLTMVPVALGLKYDWKLNCDFNAYLGVGGSYSILRIHDKSPFVHQHIHSYGWGVTAKSGLQYRFACWGYIEGFVDYNWTQFDFSGHKDNIYRNNLDMSNFLFGGGIGLTF